MNTVKSVYYGWATLIVAGGGAYYFAKKSINADRAARHEADRQRRLQHRQLEAEQFGSGSGSAEQSNTGNVTNAINKARHDQDWGRQVEAGDPSREASQDPAPTRHAPEDEAQKAKEKSKYEATEVFRSRKGDRFS